MKRRNKRAQFYLIGAIIIITLIVGFATVSNYAKKQRSVKVYDLKEELKIESGKVLEYGTFSLEERKESDFSEAFTNYTEEENREIYFVYGNKDEIKIFGSMSTGSVSVSIGGSQSGMETFGTTEKIIDPLGEEEIIVTLGDYNYTFNLKPGENFFFVISEETEGEQHIVTS